MSATFLLVLKYKVFVRWSSYNYRLEEQFCISNEILTNWRKLKDELELVNGDATICTICFQLLSVKLIIIWHCEITHKNSLTLLYHFFSVALELHTIFNLERHYVLRTMHIKSSLCIVHNDVCSLCVFVISTHCAINITMILSITDTPQYSYT